MTDFLAFIIALFTAFIGGCYVMYTGYVMYVLIKDLLNDKKGDGLK